MKKNCWEIKKCGRQPGGSKTDEFGVCPAASDETTNGINSGKNGGRCCWVLAGTYCGGEVQGTYAEKMLNCMNCEFYKQVREEEGKNYENSVDILKKIRK